tara:strand:+ start:914 stop:1723 length:810 start_codon:yes stop_codon:yes gene_type:complete
MTLLIKKVPLHPKLMVESSGFPNENELCFHLLVNKSKLKESSVEKINTQIERELSRLADDPNEDATKEDQVDTHTNPSVSNSNENEFRFTKTTSNKIPIMEKNDDEDQKRELLFKFEILRKSYPNTEIPLFSMHNDFATMNKQYEYIIRKVQLESNVDNYKSYLIGGFMLLEFLFGKVGLDMAGFSQQQMHQMNKYEKLLIELGEKSYIPKRNFPVEVRLLGLIIFNAVLFGFSKLIMEKTGTNILQAMGNILPQNKGGSKKMNGPDPI